jgi:photosystem II stability/assembly factor-like uncharacterized protein
MRRGLLVGVLVCSGACGGEATPVTQQPPAIASAKPQPPPQSGARWYFPTPASGVNDRNDLGDGSMLLVGDVGRREIVKDGKATDSPLLIPDRLVGSWRADPQQWVFVADNGDAYISREPLGPFTVRKGPGTDKLPVHSVGTGKGSALAMLSDGHVLRTADNGTSWKPLDYTGGTKLFGHIATWDIDHEGNGVLLHVPQRVFVTHDDGATWKPIAAPALGVAHAVDDARGSFLVQSYDHHYLKLQGDTLVPTTDSPQDLSTLAATGPEEPTRNVETIHVIAGDKVVELERLVEGSKSNTVRVRATRLGTVPGTWGPVVPALTSRQALSNLAAAWGPNIVVVRTDDDTDENTPTSTVVTSTDGGATWKAGPTLEGDDAMDKESVAVGPRGWTFIPALCGNFGEKQEHNCNSAKIRVAGGTTFEDLLFTNEFRPRRFAFDDAHDKVYVIGLTDAGNPTVYESKLSQNKFTPIAKPIKTNYHEHVRLTVTADGTLHVFRIDSEKSVLTIERRDVSGKELPTLWVPKRVQPDDRLQSLSLVGSRGVIMNGEAFGWETADGGATWTRVAANGTDTPECAEAGCLVGQAQRVGWDLPATAAGANAETLTATTDPPKEDEETPDDPRDDVSPAPPRMQITCKASGAATKVATEPSFESVNETRDVFWYLHEENAGKKTLTIGGRTGIRHETLLDVAPTAPKDVVRSTAEKYLSDGYVAVRYSRLPSQAVDVELGAFSLETGRVQHVTLPKVPSFRVASYGFTGEAQIVTGGLLFQSTDASPAFFIHPDGKIDHMSLPAHATLARAQHIGTAWMLFSTDNMNLAKVSYSNDSGASWQEHAWLVADSAWPRASLIRGSGGKPWISTALREGVVLYPVASPPATELPMPVVTEIATMDTPCDPKAPYAQTFVKGVTRGSTVQATVDLGDKKPATSVALSQRLTHVTPSGGYCTMGYVFYANRERVALYRDGKNMVGWAFKTPDDYKGRMATPLTCIVTQ